MHHVITKMGKIKTIQTLSEELDRLDDLLVFLSDKIPNFNELITQFNTTYDRKYTMNDTRIHVIFDASGSMAGYVNDMIGSYNEFIKSQ